MIEQQQQLELTPTDRDALSQADCIKWALLSISGGFLDCPELQRTAKRHFNGSPISHANILIAKEALIEDVIPLLATSATLAYAGWSQVHAIGAAWYEECKKSGFHGPAKTGLESVLTTHEWRLELWKLANECVDLLECSINRYPKLFANPSHQEQVAELRKRIESNQQPCFNLNSPMPGTTLEARLHSQMMRAYEQLTKSYALYLALAEGDAALTFAALKTGFKDTAHNDDPLFISRYFDSYRTRIFAIDDLRSQTFAATLMLGDTIGAKMRKPFYDDFPDSTVSTLAPHMRH
jgi:hypothetical protein